MIKKHSQQGGFIKAIIIFIFLIATLAYFNIDISSIIESEPVQVIWSFIKTAWANFVTPSVEYLWNNILRDFIFNNVVDFFTQAEQQISGTDFETLISTTTPIIE